MRIFALTLTLSQRERQQRHFYRASPLSQREREQHHFYRASPQGFSKF